MGGWAGVDGECVWWVRGSWWLVGIHVDALDGSLQYTCFVA